MRWPWQRREEGVAPQPALPPRQADAARVSPMGWAFLPPLQRQLGDMPLVARTASFPSQLPAWQNPSFTGTLAHRVSTDAPSGVIDGDGGGTGRPGVHSASPDLTLLAPTPVRQATVQRAVASSPDDSVTSGSAPLTTAAPTGLPVLAVQSYGPPPDPPSDTESEVVADSAMTDDVVPDNAVPDDGTAAEAAPGTEESSPPRAVAAPSAGTPQPVQRSADRAASGNTAASPTVPTVGARPSVGGRRFGLGAPLPAMPLASDVPPVQRTADVTPAPASVLGSEGAEGYVEVRIPPKPSRSEEPPVGPAREPDAGAEADVPTLGRSASHRETALDAAGPDTAPAAPPAMPVASVQRSAEDTSRPTASEAVECAADPSPPPADGTSPEVTVGSRAEPEQVDEGLASGHVHEGPASVTAERRADGNPAAPGTGGAQDRPVLAQRSIATGADPTSTGTLPPVTGQRGAGNTGEPTREVRHTGSHTAAASGGPQLQRATAHPSSHGVPGPTLQRSVDVLTPVASRAESTVDTVPYDDHAPPGDDTGGAESFSDPAADTPAEALPDAPTPLAIAPTRPVLGAAVPLTALATAPVQRTEETGLNAQAEPSWSPASTRTVERTAVAAARTPAVQRAAAAATLQRSAVAANGAPASASQTFARPGSPAPHVGPTAPALPLAAPSIGDEAPVQTALVEESAREPSAVAAEGPAVPVEARETSAATAGSPGPAAPGGATEASSPEQLEALAGRLFAPLMRRIRSEMLLDRERRGLRTDSW